MGFFIIIVGYMLVGSRGFGYYSLGVLIGIEIEVGFDMIIVRLLLLDVCLNGLFFLGIGLWG